MISLVELKFAIQNHLSIEIHYQAGEALRIVNPYHYGKVRGVLFLHGYQQSGYSKSGKFRGWKHFKIDEIVKLNVLSEKFQPPDEGYHPRAPHYRVEYQINY